LTNRAIQLPLNIRLNVNFLGFFGESMNKSTQLLSAVLAVGSLLLLSGCASYKAVPLPYLTKQTNSSVSSKNKNITLEHKVFTKADCKTYLGRKNILKKGYQPVQLALTNNTDRTYTYSTASLSLPTVQTELIAEKVKFSTAGRVLGSGAAAVGFVTCAACAIPIIGALGGVGASAGLAAILFIMAPAGFVATGFSVAALTDGIKSGKANKKLTIDFAAKAFPQEGILKPYQTINGIVFVPKKSFNNDFTFTLNDAQTNKPLVLSSNSDLLNVK